MANRVGWRDRMVWAVKLGLPDRLTLILFMLIKEANPKGELPLLLRKLSRSTPFDAGEIRGAVEYFVSLGLLKRDGWDDRWEQPAEQFRIVDGAKPNGVQLSLGVHACLAAVENKRDITDRQELALGKLIIRHYDWITGEVKVTTEQLLELSPRWSRHKTNEVMRELVDGGYLTRAADHPRGYSTSPHRYRLQIRTNSREMPQISEPNSREMPQISEPNSREMPQISEPNSREMPQISEPNSREMPQISEPLPYTEDSTETLSDQTLLPPAAAAGNRPCSDFWRRLMELDEQAAFALLPLEKLERASSTAWHEEWADKALEDLDELMVRRDITHPPGVVIKRFNDRLDAGWDMKGPPPRHLGDGRHGTPLGTDAEPVKVLVWADDVDPKATEIWTSVLEQLRLQLTRPNFDTLLAVTVGLDWTPSVFTVGCPSAFVAEMLEQRMYALIAQKLEDVVECEVEVQFAVQEESG